MSWKPPSSHPLYAEYSDDEQLWLWGDSDGRPVRRFEEESDRLLIGLDTSFMPVRAVVADVVEREGRNCLCPRGCATFEDLDDFSHYWNQNWSLTGARVAIPNETTDPLGVRAWLDSQKYPLERYPWMAYKAHLAGDMTLQDMAIGREFEPCYALAIHAHYRTNVAEVISGIFEKLLELQFVLNDIRGEAHRLTAAFTNPVDEIPF